MGLDIVVDGTIVVSSSKEPVTNRTPDPRHARSLKPSVRGTLTNAKRSVPPEASAPRTTAVILQFTTLGRLRQAMAAAPGQTPQERGTAWVGAVLAVAQAQVEAAGLACSVRFAQRLLSSSLTGGGDIATELSKGLLTMRQVSARSGRTVVEVRCAVHRAELPVAVCVRGDVAATLFEPADVDAWVEAHSAACGD